MIQTKYMGIIKWGFRVYIVEDLCILHVCVMNIMLHLNSSHSIMCCLLPHPQLPIGPIPHVNMRDAHHPSAQC